MLRPENMMHAALLLTLPTFPSTFGHLSVNGGWATEYATTGHHDANAMAAAYQLARTAGVPRVDVSEVF